MLHQKPMEARDSSEPPVGTWPAGPANNASDIGRLPDNYWSLTEISTRLLVPGHYFGILIMPPGCLAALLKAWPRFGEQVALRASSWPDLRAADDVKLVQVASLSPATAPTTQQQHPHPAWPVPAEHHVV
jgi:hypothetical protein